MANTSLANSGQHKVGFATFCANPAVRANIANVVGEKNTTQFISSIVSAVQSNKMLSECTNSSIFSAALLGQSLNLSPSPQLGQFYLVPYKDRRSGVSEAQFQIGSRGYIQLAIRSGQYKRIVTSTVKEGELKSYNPITEEIIFEPIMDEKLRSTLPTTGYYAMFELVNGFRKEIYWPKTRMEEHAKKYSLGYRSDVQKGTSYTFWSKDFDAMASKTLIRQLISKWGVMSIDLQRAYESDMGILNESGEVRYVDNQADDPLELAKEEIAENANKETLMVDIETGEVEA